MTQMSLTVGLGERAYDITIGPGLIDHAGSMLGEIAADRHIIIVSDNQVASMHLQRLCNGLLPVARKLDQFCCVRWRSQQINGGARAID